MGHIFISYSRKDIDITRQIYDDLSVEGLMLWIDEQLEPGSPSWKAAIQKAIEDADALVVIMSPDAKQSRWVVEELTYADNLKKRAFPILVRGDETNAIPFGLATSQWVDVRNPEDYDLELRRLSIAIHKHITENPKSLANFDAMDDEFRPNKTGKMLREARKNAGLTPFQLAEAIGVDVNVVKRMENSREIPARKLAKTIADVLKIDVHLLMDACIQDEINRVKLKYWLPPL